MYILDTCSNILGTCCTSPGIVPLLSITRKIIDFIQLIIPILLIVYATIELTKLVVNPEEKNGLKKVTNKFLAAAIVFFIPVIINALMAMMPNSFSISSCWTQANQSSEILKASSVKYVNPSKIEKNKIISNQNDYDKGDARKEENNSTSSQTTSQGSATGKSIVEYAYEFKGGTYKFGGSWNGEHPYTNTDCSGFVGGVYKHFGYHMPRSTRDMQKYFPSHFKRVNENEVQAGDVVLYYGHVALATGNGYEIIHNTRPRIKVSKDFRYRQISGIYRIVE